jgi:pimeloyl-ACP methyl ester carboxylesterase
LTKKTATRAPAALSVAVDGGDLYVECRGSGPPLLLLHGWSLDHRSFAPQIDALAESLFVIVCDRRGFGRSLAPPDLRRELDDIDRILDTLGLDSAHLLGVSQGGRIALRYTVTRPHRVRSLVLQGAIVDGLAVQDAGSERIPLEDYAALAKRGRLDEIRARWLAHPMMALQGNDPGAAALLADIVGDYEARDLIDLDPSSYRFPRDTLDGIAGFARPVLLITGAAETAARKEHARRLMESAPDCREIVMQKSGHLANLEESEAFNAAVAEFVTDAERGRA